MKRKKRERGGRGRASIAYTVGALALLAVVAFLALTYYGLFESGASREAPTTVLVLNGCGTEGLGLAATKLLRAHGLDVVDFRNAGRLDYPETIVVDRAGDMGAALEVARLLHTANVIQQIPDTPLEDIVVIIGRDHDRYLRTEDRS